MLSHPAAVADSSTNRAFTVFAITRMIVVFPHLDAPQKIIDGTRPCSIRLWSTQLGPMRSWPYTSSRVWGRIILTSGIASWMAEQRCLLEAG